MKLMVSHNSLKNIITQTSVTKIVPTVVHLSNSTCELALMLVTTSTSWCLPITSSGPVPVLSPAPDRSRLETATLKSAISDHESVLPKLDPYRTACGGTEDRVAIYSNSTASVTLPYSNSSACGRYILHQALQRSIETLWGFGGHRLLAPNHSLGSLTV